LGGFEVCGRVEDGGWGSSDDGVEGEGRGEGDTPGYPPCHSSCLPVAPREVLAGRYRVGLGVRHRTCESQRR